MRMASRIRPPFLIVTAFWAYVAASNVIYAHSMQESLAALHVEDFFAGWEARLLQHLFLYPLLLGGVWGSLRIGWQPIARRLPLQAADGRRVRGRGIAGALAGGMADERFLALSGDVGERRRSHGRDAGLGAAHLAGECHDLPPDLRVRHRPGERLRFLSPAARLADPRRGARAGAHERASGVAAHAALAAFALQPAAHHPRPDRVGPGGGAHHDRAARRSAAPPAQRRRAGILTPRRRDAVRTPLPRAAAAAFR